MYSVWVSECGMSIMRPSKHFKAWLTYLCFSLTGNGFFGNSICVFSVSLAKIQSPATNALVDSSYFCKSRELAIDSTCYDLPDHFVQIQELCTSVQVLMWSCSFGPKSHFILRWPFYPIFCRGMPQNFMIPGSVASWTSLRILR